MVETVGNVSIPEGKKRGAEAGGGIREEKGTGVKTLVFPEKKKPDSRCGKGARHQLQQGGTGVRKKAARPAW